MVTTGLFTWYMSRDRCSLQFYGLTIQKVNLVVKINLNYLQLHGINQFRSYGADCLWHWRMDRVTTNTLNRITILLRFHLWFSIVRGTLKLALFYPHSTLICPLLKNVPQRKTIVTSIYTPVNMRSTSFDQFFVYDC